MKKSTKYMIAAWIVSAPLVLPVLYMLGFVLYHFIDMMRATLGNVSLPKDLRLTTASLLFGVLLLPLIAVLGSRALRHKQDEEGRCD